jgi:hypothetical protein
MSRKFAAAAVLFVLATAPAVAQAPPPGLGWVRGTVATIDGDKLAIKTTDGTVKPVALTSTTRIQSLVKKSLADIKPGDFLASAGVRGKDGKIHAIEVRIFPKAMPNGGGQFAWDLGAGGVMTNALVGTVTKAPQGEVVHVTFKGGASEYSIGPDVPILAPAPGDRSLLKPGAAVIAFGRKAPDGGLTAAAIYAEKNGIKPPM